ncbi:MAG: nucleoside triphosphate pyrophosphohydrolase [Syntrophorhabdales bacterium]|jgi:MazG family protein
MEEFSKLVELMEFLRGEHGCPWDKKQTEQAFKTFLLEEVYELIEAIENEDYQTLREELGDLLFHIVFISQICKEKERFDIRDVIRDTYNKMYGRHPHVFLRDGDERPIEERWEEIKSKEKADYSPVSHVPRILPALLRAYVVSKRAAKAGFDWEKLEDVHEKMDEEIGELREAEASATRKEIEEEIGDLLFTVANIARFHGIDPENALRRTIGKFVKRFRYIEQNLDLAKGSPQAMDALWNEIKEREKRGK